MKTAKRWFYYWLVPCLIVGWAFSLFLVPSTPVLAQDPPPPAEESQPVTPEGPLPLPPHSEEELELHTALDALETARRQGPKAVVALLDTLHGAGRDAVMADVLRAREELAASAPPLAETAPLSLEAEEAANQTQIALDAAFRTTVQDAVSNPDGDAPDWVEPQSPLPASNAPAADLTVGSPPCTYATLAAAYAAANPGDRLLLEGGVSLPTNLTIHMDLTIQGGYNGCGSGLSTPTTLDGGNMARVFEINNGLTVNLANLLITNGNSPNSGGGIRIWENTQVNGDYLQIFGNSALTVGGGIRLVGGRISLTHSNIYNNTAPEGAGVDGDSYVGYAPSLDLPASADIHDNQALTGNGYGGGVSMTQGSLSLADCSDIYSNDAILGGGTYLITSTLTIAGDCSEIDSNTATGNGGGIFAQGSIINLDNAAELVYNQAGFGGTGSGGGAFLYNSQLWGDMAKIDYNTADFFGGGVFATNGSLLDMDLGGNACSGPRCSELSYNTTVTYYGGAVYAAGNSEIDLSQVFVEDNTASTGGAIYAYLSPVYLSNSLLAHNNATNSGGVDGLRLFTGATLTGSDVTLAHNDAGGAATGSAIGLSGAALTLENSIIWGHASSINLVGQAVTCSDIQGGYTGEDNRNEDPLFVSPASSNFHLQSTSPVLDRCTTGTPLDFDDDPRPVVYVRPVTPYDMGADEGSMRVGLNGGACAYGRIQDAVDAAVSGDTIQAAVDTFTENVVITSKNLTIAGGYAADCVTPNAGRTTVNGGGSASVFTFSSGGNSIVTLRNLDLTGGNSSNGGGVLIFYSGGQVTLDNTDVFNNQGGYGGGVYVDLGGALTMSNDSDITNNTATSYGGGARVWGVLIANGSTSTISNNKAPNGGGLAIPSGGIVGFHGADITDNQATGAAGVGGGVYVYGNASFSASDSTNISRNTAYNGAGIYADDAYVFMDGAVTHSNTATFAGGGIYLANGSVLTAPNADIGVAQETWGSNSASFGGGLYTSSSFADVSGQIVNNVATYQGGGIYATGGTLHLTGAYVGGRGPYQPNQLGPAGHEGAGLYLTDSASATIVDTLISSNAFQTTGYTYGGGAYITGSSGVTMTRTTVELHQALSPGDGRGAGLYVSDSTVSLSDSAVQLNTAGTIGGGMRIIGDSTVYILGGTQMTSNQALTGQGGALAAASGEVNLMNASFQSNYAVSGGAVYMSGGILNAHNAVFTSNFATTDGGAIAAQGAIVLVDVYYYPIPTLSSALSPGPASPDPLAPQGGGGSCDPLLQECSSFYDNRADSDGNLTGNGGAIYSNNSRLTVSHTYLHHNQAARGGAIFQEGTAPVVSMTNTLLHHNTVSEPYGAGIRSLSGSFALDNVTIADNAGGAGYSQAGTTSSIYHSIAWGNASGGFLGTFTTAICNIDQTGNAGAVTDPLFRSPGAGENYRLRGVSPAIDACPGGISPDLDNLVRPIGSAYDIGAYEYTNLKLFLPLIKR